MSKSLYSVNSLVLWQGHRKRCICKVRAYTYGIFTGWQIYLQKEKEGWEEFKGAKQEVLRRGGDCNFKEPGLGGFTTEVWELALVSGGTTFQAGVERELTQRSPVRPVLFCNLFLDPSFLSCPSKEHQGFRVVSSFLSSRYSECRWT